jgi:hypothetical protein
MSIPNFTADASLYKTNRVYRTLSFSNSVSGNIYLADFVDQDCYNICRATCKCSDLTGADRGRCNRECNTDCSNECTRPGDLPKPPRPSCGGSFCPPGFSCCNDFCIPFGDSCCGPGSCRSGTSCCEGKGCCRSGTFCCEGKGCCPDGSSCQSLFGFTFCLNL